MLRSMGSGGKEPTACQRGQSGFRHCRPVWAGRLLATPPGNRSMARGTRFGGKRTPKRGKRTPKRGKRLRSSLSRLFANHLLSEGSRVNQSPDRSDDKYHSSRMSHREIVFDSKGMQNFEANLLNYNLWGLIFLEDDF